MNSRLIDVVDAGDQRVRVSDTLVQELDRRKEAAEQDPSLLVPWEVVKERLGIRSVAAGEKQA